MLINIVPAACPSHVRREVAGVFPGLQPQQLDSLLIIPTCQHAAMDLVQTGEAVDTEKDLLLEKVLGKEGVQDSSCMRMPCRQHALF